MVGLGPTIHPTVCCVRGWLDPRDKPEDDSGNHRLGAVTASDSNNEEGENRMEKARGSMKPSEAKGDVSASRLIDARITKLGDWRGEMLARVRALIKQADPDVVEEVKWRKPSNAMLGVPVWEHDGIICTGETYKNYVKLTFAKGAALDDPAGLFNASLEGNVRRAIDIREGDRIDAAALKALVRAAVALNTTKKPKRA
jgi:hypothetical protein